MNVRSTMMIGFSIPIHSSSPSRDYPPPQVSAVIKHLNHFIQFTLVIQDVGGRMDNSLSIVAGLFISNPLSFTIPLKEIRISHPMMCGYKRFQHFLIIDRPGTPVHVPFQNVVTQSSGFV